MNDSTRPYRPLWLPALALVALALSACSGGGGSSPTSPGGGALIVDSTGTATQIEPNGFRLQVRYDLVNGNLAQAVAQGRASVRICLGSTCVEGPVSAQFGEASCRGVNLVPADGNALGFGLAWFDGASGGVDFCIADLIEDQVFQTTIADGSVHSNTIFTACSSAGGLLTCGSNS